MRFFAALLFVAAFLASAPALHAQDATTFAKGADINAWGGFLSTVTDRNTGYNKGVTVGANLTMFFNLPVSPAIEVRANLSDGSIDNLKSYDVGLRLRSRTFAQRFHVYGDFLAGFGTAHYVNCNDGNPGPSLYPGGGPNCALRGDNAPVYSPGGGLNYNLSRRFSAVGDVQYELWNFGHNITIHPLNTTIGLSYRLPFRDHTRYEDYH